MPNRIFRPLVAVTVSLLLGVTGAFGQVQDGKTLAPADATPGADIASKGASATCAQGFADVYPCENVDLLAHMDRTAFEAGHYRLNDIWGWEDPDTGRRYVLQGLENATAFVDITDPTVPVFLGKLPLTSGARASVWRDIKVYDNHAFIVADGAGSHGMQVFDLTQLRGLTGAAPVEFAETARYEGFGSAHNVVMNEATGFAFAVGSSRGQCDRGLQMIDVRDPRRPLLAGCFLDQRTRRGYVHDAQCVVYEGPDTSHQGREICFASNEDAVSIVDVTDKAQPRALGVGAYPTSGYVHQGWLSDDQRYFYQNDELDERVFGENTRTLIWDVMDLDDPQLAVEYVHDTPAIDHNLYISDGLLFQANYTAGLRVLDIADPDDPVAVGHFDTTPDDNQTSFNGTWSVYPWFSDGTVALSSRSEGLFLLNLTGILATRLSSFSAAAANETVAFTWTMRRQAGVARFEVQRVRVDGTVEVVASIPGGTDSVEAREFSLETDDLPPGRSLVRLVSVSVDGSTRQLAQEELFVVPGTHVVTGAYPNPATESARMRLVVANAQDVSVEVFDLAGRRVALLHQGRVEPGQELIVDARVAGWPAGRYWVRYQGLNFSDARMLVVGR
ncbi:MAG: choice-of-anchor B family protein [Rhodothermales bacterium]|nr:choice-of-anchor B family protein [Rhodothermales bacterium]